MIKTKNYPINSVSGLKMMLAAIPADVDDLDEPLELKHHIDKDTGESWIEITPTS
jgi:hypothetical protein